MQHPKSQLKLFGKIRQSRSGGEVITFDLSLLGLVNMTVIVTVPEEGTEKAPVYIKLSGRQHFDGFEPGRGALYPDVPDEEDEPVAKAS